MDLLVLALLFWSAIASALAFWWSPVGPGRTTATLEDLAEHIELTEFIARRRVSREELSAVKNQKDLARRLLSDMRQDVVARLGRGNCFAVTRKDVPSKPHVEYEMRCMVALDAYTTPTPGAYPDHVTSPTTASIGVCWLGSSAVWSVSLASGCPCSPAAASRRVSSGQ